MEPSHPPTSNLNPTIAAILSALVPGLGQMYCGRWAKGALFFFVSLMVGFALFTSHDLDRFEQTLLTGQVPDNVGLVLSLSLVLLAVALWSVVDAVRTSRRSH